ncbi:P-loop ATPase, Sll1717 family [Photobacterium andalusiense]|uniref:Uncharacterized protein n=1 Tax=Photobacterium andalusiense TaxID=2204296 RepID=A0A1Y6MLL5_9GAMM|nr:HypX [Photobacterium andalusiense]SMY37497.1 hypothetical protein PAND9192_03150 [Photobacterium andalusiense]
MKGNILGDIRAEHDVNMLENSFWQTTEYKSLLESYDRCIIVGRRGTGKSALVHMLSKHWENRQKTQVLVITPVEEQIIGLRDVLKLFGDNYLHIKAGSKLAWRYAIYMEVITEMVNHYKLKNFLDIHSIQSHIVDWGSRRNNITRKIRRKLISILESDDKNKSPESRIADLSDAFELDLLEEVILEAAEKGKFQFVLFADKLDEGYTPDNLGVAIVDGFVQSVIDIKHILKEKVIAFAFIRDNIYRAISKNDPDFTRNIEGQTLRIHWDEYNLFNLVCNRLRVAFNSNVENNTRVWNAHTADELKSLKGFRFALKLTLYRPRDILVLLNDAFLRAGSQNRTNIIFEDIDATAKTISNNRLNDLHKEYETVFPALERFTKCFSNEPQEVTLNIACDLINKALDNNDVSDKLLKQDLILSDNPAQVIQRLYSVGFIGLYNDTSSSYVFCHDGKDPDRDFNPDSKLLIHPCYLLALNNQNIGLNINNAEDIHDEYDIEVSSIDKEFRKQKIGTLISDLNKIAEGHEEQLDFYSWVLKSIKVLLAAELVNIEITQKNNFSTISATNIGNKDIWNEILNEYKCSEVFINIYNKQGLSRNDYLSISDKIFNKDIKLAFIINRDKDNNISKDTELKWVREIYNKKGILIIKLSSKFLERQLSKSRNPQKHDDINKEMKKLIKTYTNTWVNIKKK